MKRRAALRVLGGSAVFGLAGCLGDTGSSGPKTVRMVGLEYKPDRLSIEAGRTVEWVNDGDIGHTVTAYEAQLPDGAPYWASGGFETEEAARKNLSAGLVNAGESYRRTFEATGEHPYFCVPHEGSGMTGTLTVG